MGWPEYDLAATGHLYGEPMSIDREGVDPVSFGDVGIGEDAVEMYTHLARRGPVPVDDLDAEVLQQLLEVGLATSEAGRVDALAPRAALETIADRHRQAVAAAHRAADTLAEVWHAQRAASSSTVVHTGTAADEAVRAMIASAEDELVALNLGPRGSRKVRPAPGVIDALQRGLTIRVLYDKAILSDPAALEVARECIGLGEKARVLPDVPVNLLVTHRQASLTLPYVEGKNRRIVLSSDAGVVEAMRRLFESFWTLGMPLRARSGPLDPDTGDGLPDWSADLLMLLGLGLTEGAIARELGISERTVGRRITRLQQALGARSRFQLGAQATRRGLI